MRCHASCHVGGTDIAYLLMTFLDYPIPMTVDSIWLPAIQILAVTYGELLLSSFCRIRFSK
ncbi:hypothetical protein V1527DRAFT_477001 [Lipomyces starkeyi]